MMGRPTWSNYTIEGDVRGLEARRQRGDIGLVNQRYMLVLFGNASGPVDAVLRPAPGAEGVRPADSADRRGLLTVSTRARRAWRAAPA